MKKIDKRGEILTVWIASDDLVVSNIDEKTALRRKYYGARHKLTLSTTDITTRIRNCEVSFF